jgi:DNA repair protein RecO (recombination protein O)
MRNSTSHSSAGFVLHSYPYKETSLILETFTRSHGRVAMVAKGAKRNGSHKYALNAFQPITIDWFGRADLKTLKAADHERIYPQMRGSALMAAFYINELLLKLAAKDDPHETLFDAYDEAVAALSNCSTAAREIEAILRRFELAMLAELGYALTLDHEADSDIAIDAEAEYWYVVDRGPIRANGNQEVRGIDPVLLSGKTIRTMAQNELDMHADPQILSQAKQLMRRVINHHLGDKALHTRQLIRELK